jgi:UDP-N-acetylglucosamine transferase subunit ALG13/adenine/guanine phosphoribosyltransferase-like PRPP-binding protein
VLGRSRSEQEIFLIFLTVGTWRNGYDRLVKAIDDLVASGLIDVPVKAQIGYGQYRPKHLEIIDFCPPDEFASLIAESAVVVSHAGMGTIAQAVKNGKPIVVLPRKCALGEVDSDHQFDTAAQLEAEGKILVAREIGDLPGKIREAGGFVPRWNEAGSEIVRVVDAFVDQYRMSMQHRRRHCLWPYRILRRDDEGIRADLLDIVEHFCTDGPTFTQIVFIREAGTYLGEMFAGCYDGRADVGFVTVRRASTVASRHQFKDFVWRRRWLSDVMRHVEVFVRLIRVRLGCGQKMVADVDLDFDPKGKHILVIDDSVDTGTTMNIVRSLLFEKGAALVRTACISNHLVPEKVFVDYAVYRHRLLRTRNSGDYDAA